MQPGVVLLDRYELVGRLGQGATSAVWEAIDHQGGERVAVKAISLDEAGWRAEVRDRFQQEARLLALGRHEHLVGVRDVGETDDGYLFIVLEKLTGETLADRIGRPPPLDWREAARTALQIARGLSALHARGIVHRDIKPANVMLHRDPCIAPAEAAEPVAKIIDLGVSKVRAAAADPVLYATLTATGQVIGTPQYMSYEQALGERDIDARSDVWAVGVVLYEMLAGRRPFEAPNVNAVLASIRRGAPPSLAALAPEAPPELVALVSRCLAQSRSARFPDGQALASALEAVITAGERSSLARPRRYLRAAAGAVLAATTGAGAYLLLCAPAPAPLTPAPNVALASRAAPPSVAPLPTSPASASEPPRAEGKLPAPPPPAAPSASTAPAMRKTALPARPITRIDQAGF